ncbi:MAG: D-alanyl-D-alanine carboxypeptidase [Oscillospiraceae bacterium]|nr:D-alanyl-D-alanine carboxypeptidase [Oscillospiraceae bacterium]
MKRLLAGTAAAILAAALVFPCEAVSAESAILLDAQTGRVLYEKQADKQSLIASTTKIMTALVVCEQTNVLDRVRIPPEAVGIEGSSMYLKAGEIMTVQELLYGLMLHSGNDAAVALAIYCGGTVEGFAELMNDKAHRLGMHDTHFVNPNGLDAPGHYSTARDMAKLAAYAMENPIFTKTVSTKTVKAAGRTLTNHNKLLWSLDGAEGVKTGFTKAAGRILVSSCSRQGRRLIAVTMNDRNDWQDHKQLMDGGFADFSVRQLVTAGECLGTVQVISGEKETVQLLAAEDFSYALTAEEQPELVLSKPGFVYAPVVSGQDAGFAYLCLNGKSFGKIPLIYGETVETEEIKKPSLWEKLLKGGKQ